MFQLCKIQREFYKHKKLSSGGNGEAASSPSLSLSLYEITHTICQMYPVLSPFDVREKPDHEVIYLINRLIEKGNSQSSTAGTAVARSEDKVIRKRVYADTADWY